MRCPPWGEEGPRTRRRLDGGPALRYVPGLVNAETQEELRSQLERLQESLSARRSVLHFAHTGVSFIAALILAGAAAKLFWDSAKVSLLAFAVSAVALGLVVYGLVHYRRGRRVLAEELKRYNDMLELRRRLRLDNPSTLLPR
jgi:hypothetical protein